MAEKSAYELAREVTIAGNRAKLIELGLEASVPARATPRPRTPRAAKEAAEPTRASKRIRRETAAPAPLPLPDDDEPLLPETEDVSPRPSPKRRAAALRPPRSASASALIGHVRRLVEENLPDDHALEERSMFGMCMWLVRGNMFIGVGLNSERLLVRVGEPAVEPLLAAHPEGVRRCGQERVFPGTLMVEPAQYKGEAQMRAWFEHALAYNGTMQAKEPSAKPRKRAGAAAGAMAGPAAVPGSASRPGDAAAQAAAAEEPTDGGAPPAPPQRRPASTSGGAFARCVLRVVRAIPRGRVASYGQVAALAGAPRNARQVGHLLKEGLAAGGMPWWRVLGASGKSSLPADAGGATQRANLESEGVVFRETGAVDPQMMWARTEPFYVPTPVP